MNSSERTDKATVRRRVNRPVQPGIPAAKAERDRLRMDIRAFVERERVSPPLSVPELQALAARAVDALGTDAAYRDFVAILIHNAAWRETVAGIPYDRRLLLVPQCLRDAERCRGEIDEYGLLCRRCGRCVLDELHEEAEALGYAVMVAEGSAVVMSLVESGRIQAVIGVSCLSVLEQVYPYMEAGAVPGLAIPLLQDGCRDTAVDVDWLLEEIHRSSEHPFTRLALDDLRERVDGWFAREELDDLLGRPAGEAERLGRDWLALAGKRWRPFLAATAYQALCDEPEAPLPADVRRAAVAVECFHKASLIHDDIEDGERERYGAPTMHVARGVPVALNVGDFLLGEGYRLLAECDGPAPAMLRAAARGHRELSLGQGAELTWRGESRELSLEEVLDIFRRKTAPAFEVALRVGAACAGAPAELDRPISRYCEALGIAYQIRDDLRDFDGHDGDLAAGRPSVVRALARAKLRGPVTADAAKRCGAVDEAWALLESHKDRAIHSLAEIDSVALKCLLRRIVGKIFCDVEIMPCCDDAHPDDPDAFEPQ